MNISFTKEQYLLLIKALYYGNWLVNANRTNDVIEEYDDLEDYVLSFAKEFGIGKDVVRYDEKTNKPYITSGFESTELDEHIDDYDSEAFWNQLANRLACRDLLKIHGKEQITQMDAMEIFKLTDVIEDEYYEEFRKHGIERLEIIRKIEL